MPTQVEIPNIGTVEFPDDMQHDAIKDAVKGIVAKRTGSALRGRDIQNPAEDIPTRLRKLGADPYTAAGISTTLSPKGELEPVSAGSAITEEGFKPFVPLPDVPSKETLEKGWAEKFGNHPWTKTAAKIERGADISAKGLLESVESPVGLLTAGTGPILGKVAQRLLALAFAPSLVKGASQKAGEASVTGDPETWTQAGLEGGLGLLTGANGARVGEGALPLTLGDQVRLFDKNIPNVKLPGRVVDFKPSPEAVRRSKAISDRIAELEIDPQVTGEKITGGRNPDGSRNVEQVMQDIAKLRELKSLRDAQERGATTSTGRLGDPAAIRQLGVRRTGPALTGDVLSDAEMQAAAERVMAEQRPGFIAKPGDAPAIDVFSRMKEQQVAPGGEPTARIERPGGGPAMGGKISFAGEAEAGAIPSARQAATEVPSPDILPPEPIRQEVTGPEGPYRVPRTPPTAEELARRNRKQSIIQAMNAPEVPVEPLPGEPFGEAPGPIPQGQPMSNLQKQRLENAIAKGASDEVIRNILRLPPGEKTFLTIQQARQGKIPLIGETVVKPSIGGVRSAAIKVGDKIIEGPTHVDAYEKAKSSGTPDTSGAQEGFVTADGSFISREEAAKRSGLPTSVEPGKLHSEDLLAAQEKGQNAVQPKDTQLHGGMRPRNEAQQAGTQVPSEGTSAEAGIGGGKTPQEPGTRTGPLRKAGESIEPGQKVADDLGMTFDGEQMGKWLFTLHDKNGNKTTSIVTRAGATPDEVITKYEVKRQQYGDQPNAPRRPGKTLTELAYDLGKETPTSGIEDLRKSHAEQTAEFYKALEAGDLEKARDLSAKTQYYTEAIRMREAIDEAQKLGSPTPEQIAEIESRRGVGGLQKALGDVQKLKASSEIYGSEMAHPDTVGIIKKGGRLGDVLRSVAKNSKDWGKIASQLFAIADEESLRSTVAGKDGFGRDFYDPKHDQINIHLGDGNVSTGVVIHEAIHALTARKIPSEVGKLGGPNMRGEQYVNALSEAMLSDKVSTPVKRLIRNYLDAVDSHPDERAKAFAGDPDALHQQGLHYGLGNIDEFVAETFSRPEFQKWLDSIPSDKPGKSLWKSFVDTIRSLIGIPAKAGSMLEDAIRAGAELVQARRLSGGVVDEPAFSAPKPEGMGGASREEFSRPSIGDVINPSLREKISVLDPHSQMRPEQSLMTDAIDFLKSGKMTKMAQPIKGWLGTVMGKSFPKTTLADRLTGELGARYAASRAAAAPIADVFVNDVLTGLEVDPAKFDAALKADNLLSIKEGFEKEARDAASKGKTSEAIGPAVNALRVNTLLGTKNFPFKTEAELQKYFQDPQVAEAINRHKDNWNAQVEPMYKEAAGIDRKSVV
jgi:hypothetical protein